MPVQFEWNWEGLLDTLRAAYCLHVFQVSSSKLYWSITALWTCRARSLFRAESPATWPNPILLQCGVLALRYTSSTALALSSFMNIAFEFNSSAYALLFSKNSFFFWFDLLRLLLDRILVPPLEVMSAFIFQLRRPWTAFASHSASFGLLSSSFGEKGMRLLYRKGIWLERRIGFKCKRVTSHSIGIGSTSSGLNISCVRIASSLRSFLDFISRKHISWNDWFWRTNDFLRFVALLGRQHSVNLNCVLNSRRTGN